MATISEQGIHYQFIETKHKPVLVLAHPLGMNMRVWDYLVPDLMVNFSILRYDLPGHGDSVAFPANTKSLGESQLVDDLLTLCSSLGIDKFHFMGTSIGGMLGQQLLISHPERLLSTMLTNTGMKIGSTEAWLERQKNVTQQGLETLAASLVPRWFSPVSTKRFPTLLSQWEGSLTNVDDHSYGLLCAWLGERDTHTQLKPNGAPILLIAGEDDVATPTSSLQALGETLSAPVTELKQTGHVPSVEACREFTSLIKEHFSKRDI